MIISQKKKIKILEVEGILKIIYSKFLILWSESREITCFPKAQIWLNSRYWNWWSFYEGILLLDRPEFESYLYPLVAMESWASFNISDTSFSFFFFNYYGLGRSPGGGHGNPLEYSCLENPHGQRSQGTTVPGVTKSRTWLSNLAHRWRINNITLKALEQCMACSDLSPPPPPHHLCHLLILITSPSLIHHADSQEIHTISTIFRRGVS